MKILWKKYYSNPIK